MASGSARRYKLLKQLNIPFTTHVSSIKENFDSSDKPSKIVQMLAFQKAKDVSQHHQNAVIIGADTLVALNDEIIGKPATKQNAKEVLQKLNGQTHRVLTGVALIKTNAKNEITKETLFYDETYVTFAHLDSSMIKKYINTGGPMDKAGAYGIQDKLGAIFVKKINGNYNNVVGLPTHKLYHRLKALAPQIFND